MNVDFYHLKINLITNVVRDYFTLNEIACVGVLFSEEEQKLKIVCSYGMSGQDYSMYIGDLLEEQDVYTMLKMLVTQLRSTKE